MKKQTTLQYFRRFDEKEFRTISKSLFNNITDLSPEDRQFLRRGGGTWVGLCTGTSFLYCDIIIELRFGD